VAVKIAGRAGGDERLAHEALVLAAAAHPGVVELCGLAAPDGELELRTRWVGSRSLADAIPLPAPQVALIIGAVAETVADLHRMGLVHGRIDATHVLFDDGGRPVLCGFSGAGGLARATATTPGPRTGDDVAALGELLTIALGPVPTDGLIPDHRFGRTRTRHQLHRSLLVLADTATVDDPNARPSARALAAGIQRLTPDLAPASSLDHLRATVGPSETRRDTRRLRAAVLAVGILLVGLGIIVVTRPAPESATAGAAPLHLPATDPSSSAHSARLAPRGGLRAGRGLRR
jgi:eukaryotic-like serine/threonine-protein kinase